MNKFYVVCLLLPILISCTTTNYYKGKNDIHGIVYDKNKNPVSDYELILVSENIDGLYKTVTDVSGKFYFGNISAGKYRIKGSGDFYESYKDEIIISSKSQYIIVNTMSVKDLCDELEYDLMLKKFNECENKIQRLKKLQTDEELIFMYEVIFHYVKENYEYLIEILNDKIKNKNSNEVFNKVLEVVNNKLI